LKARPEFIEEIKKIEQTINERPKFYLPKSRVRAAASKIRNGDILGITTTIDGMDCSHTGIALWKDGTLRLMHAPVPGSKVQISPVPLWDYLANNRKQTGIIVMRALDQ
jgi:hypothetical protein